MILACQYTRLARVFEDEREGTMPAYIQEGINVALSVLDDEEWIAGDLIADVMTWLLELEAVGDEDPRLREDGPAFELIEGGLPIPRSRQGACGVCCRAR